METKKEAQVILEVNSLINRLSDKLDPFCVEAYRLALHGINIRGIEDAKTLYNLFNILNKSIANLELAVSFTVAVLRTFGYTNLSELSKYGQRDFNMASNYPKVDLLLTVTAFFDNLASNKDQQSNALDFVSSVYMDNFNHKSVSIPQFVKMMSDKGVITEGDVSKLDSLASRYRPNFFAEYLKRSKKQVQGTNGDASEVPQSNDTDGSNPVASLEKGVSDIFTTGNENTDSPDESIVSAPVPPVALFPELKNIKINTMPFSEDLVKGITVLLMTATPLELRGIMGYLKPKDAKGKIIETYTDAEAGRIRFYIGKYGQYPVVVGMSAPSKSHQGPISACNITTKLMNTVKPHYVIAVGICYGMDKSKTSSGDVIVSDLICDYTCLRVNNTLQPRGGTPPVGATLLQVFSSPVGYFHTQGGKEVEVHCSPFISKPDLVDNPIYKKELKRLRPDALGGEMEGAGIMAAVANDTSNCKVEAIVIKAICDWGDGKKSEAADWKPFSSHAAARYVHHQMDKPGAALEIKQDV